MKVVASPLYTYSSTIHDQQVTIKVYPYAPPLDSPPTSTKVKAIQVPL